ncbi:hypothetical protein TWF281_005285 [Arthrobotrys megalospora]
MGAIVPILLPTAEREPLCPFRNLPSELHYNILEKAHVSQYPTLRLVCTKWYNFIENTLPFGRYVPANIKLENPPLSSPKELPPLGLCMESSLWLVHRGISIFSKYRIDPKHLNLQRVTIGIDFVNSSVMQKLEVLRTGQPTEDGPLARLDGTDGHAVDAVGLFCGKRDISHYLSDPVYALDPAHPEYGKYKGRLDILQNWKFVPAPPSFDPAAQPCASVQNWLQSFLDRYDWEKFDEDLKGFGASGIGLHPSSVEIEAQATSQSTGYWKKIKTTEEDGGKIDRYCLEVATKVFILGCRYRAGEEWAEARPNSPTGFTFGEIDEDDK